MKRMNKAWEIAHTIVDVSVKKAPSTYGLSLLFLIYALIVFIIGIPIEVYYYRRDKKQSKPTFIQRSEEKKK